MAKDLSPVLLAAMSAARLILSYMMNKYANFSDKRSNNSSMSEYYLGFGMGLGAFAAMAIFLPLGLLSPVEQFYWSLPLILLGIGCAVARKRRFGRWL